MKRPLSSAEEKRKAGGCKAALTSCRYDRASAAAKSRRAAAYGSKGPPLEVGVLMLARCGRFEIGKRKAVTPKKTILRRPGSPSLKGLWYRASCTDFGEVRGLV